MDFTITIKEVLLVFMMAAGGFGAYYKNQASVDKLTQDHAYTRIEIKEIKAQFKDQQKINETVIRLEVNIQGIEERTKLILQLLQDRPR